MSSIMLLSLWLSQGFFTMVGINLDCAAFRFRCTSSIRFYQNIFIPVCKKKSRNIPVSNCSPLLGVLCALSASSLHSYMC